MELSKPGQTAAFQTGITPPQIPQSDNQFPIFTPTNWALLQNRPNLPNPNSLPIRPFAPSRILMPWESPLQPVQSPHQHQLRPNVQNAPQITKISPKSGPPKGLSKQVSNKRPIQQIQSAQKSQNSQIESVRSKLRESLAGALSIPTGEKSTGEDNNSEPNNSNSENKSNNSEPSNDSTSIVDELLQGNGLCWAPDSLLIPQNTPQNPNSPLQNPKNPLQNPQTLAFKIESELFRLYNGVNKKYKEKGRSLLFNLKDPSNPKLRERVLNSEISPEKLCAMSAEELASDELSEWRQAKAEEMDKMIVLPDESIENRKRVKKTHKGEFVVIEEEKDESALDMEIKAPTGVSARLVEKDKEKSEGTDDLMLDLLGEEFKEDLLEPVVTLDEFMKDLDSEPPFEDIVVKNEEKNDEVKREKVEEERREREGEEEERERERGEVMWEGVVQMNLAALASVAAIYKSGEKPPSMKEWPGFIEIKGRVRLDPFEKFLKDLPLSRSRAIMITEIKWKEGSMESGRQNLLETIESYIADSRVGLAEPGPGVELYLCPSNEKMLELFTKLLPKDLSANLQLSKTSLIGVIVWRRPVLTTVSPKLQNNNNNKNNVKKENVGSVRSSSFRERERNNSALKTVRNDSKNDDDDVPPGFGHMVGKNKDDDDLPEFDFRASAKSVNVKPVQQMRDLIQKYGSSSSSTKSGIRKNLSVETKSWNEDDDDIPEWNPNQDYQKLGNQIPNFEQQNVRNVYSNNNNGQFIVPSQQMLQPPLNAQPVMPVVQPNYQANYQVNNANYQASNVNYQVNNNSNSNQWWGQGASSAQQQQTQFAYRMPNQNWRGN
ncbi:hypothetical protein LUZ60_012286 [Juncus effusus]|nr:hypothetical protein LUZ60_012286 [Juncus effusus]